MEYPEHYDDRKHAPMHFSFHGCSPNSFKFYLPGGNGQPVMVQDAENNLFFFAFDLFKT